MNIRKRTYLSRRKKAIRQILFSKRVLTIYIEVLIFNLFPKKHMDKSMDVVFQEPERVNLLGYFLCDLLKTKVSTVEGRKKAGKIKGTVRFVAGEMACTATFRAAGIEISCEQPLAFKVQIRGELSGLVDLALGASYVLYLLLKRIRVKGDVFVLLRVVSLFKTKPGKQQ